MRIEWSDEVMVKVAESEGDRIRLAHEEAVLRAVAHPAVVRVAACDRAEAGNGVTRLSLHRVRGTTLAEVAGQPEEVVAGWGAAVATVVADLHDLGYVHGAIAAEHVLVDEQGRPILCGFSRAGRIDEVGGDVVAEDIRGVAGLVADLLPAGGGPLDRAIINWREGRHRRRPSARALAKAIVDRVPDAAVKPVRRRDGPVEDPSALHCADGAAPDTAGRPVEAAEVHHKRESLRAGACRRHPSRAVVGALVAAAVAVAGVGGGLTLSHKRSATAARAVSPSPSAPYSAYLVRSTPDEHTITVVGRWGCSPARPAVLDSRSGSIWTFPAWPNRGGTLTGTFVRQVPGASGLAVVANGTSCDRLLVLRPGQPDMAVTLGSGG